VDSPLSRVAHVDRRKAWSDAVFASLRPRDRVSDEDIFEILSAGSDGEGAAALCEARGVTVPMYCVWKAKYRNLSLDQLRVARREEVRRARYVRGALVMVAVLAVGGIAVALGRAAQAPSPSAPDPALVATAPPPAAPPPVVTVDRQPDAAPASASSAEAPIAPAVDRRAPPAPPPPAIEPGYHVQVAAANTLQEGRAIVDRLLAAGHRAYLFPTVVGDVEVFRVRVGPFDTLAAAQESSAQLKRDGHTGAWIALLPSAAQ
jgi:cell division septation protein DedD